MTENGTLKYLENLHSKIIRSSFAKNVTESEIMALVECKKMIKEIQQYRAIETELREHYHANVDIKILIQHFIKTIFKGEKHEGFCILTNKEARMWDEYRAIGTVEECREARERQRAKKCNIIEPCKSVTYYQCPCCNELLHINENFCGECGQAISWEGEDV